MGCCLTTPKPAPPPPAKCGVNKSTAESRAPPPAYEEETVKEVLSSETPNPKPPPRPPLHFSPVLPPPPPSKPEPDLVEKKEIRAVDPVPEVAVAVEKVERNEEKFEISEQDPSEVCSVSISLSESVMSTVTNDDEVKQPANRRSPAASKSSARNRAGSTADSGPRRERFVGRSPTKRSDRSPAKRNYSAATGGGGGGHMMRSGHNPVGARKPARPDMSRRDPGDSSGRRSRSPATTHRSATAAAAAGGGGRNGLAKRTANQSPSRVRKDPPQVSGGDESRDGKWGNEHRGREEEEDATPANESLENPLVSLECFIFL
ncbi:hypothetical protein LINGRAHAP2_LOCUS5441 [Linum grandiflorum]